MAPTAPPQSPKPGCECTDVGLTLDVNDLARSCDFYARVLGFEVVQVKRAGLIYEERLLRSPTVPRLSLTLRAAFGKRATGGGPGSILTISLAVPRRSELVGRLGATVKWIGPAPGQTDASPNPRFADPDGYQIELVG